MELKEVDGRWLARKSKKAKSTEDVTDIIKFDGEFCSVMGKAGRTNFHSYLGKSKSRWLEMHGVTSLLGYWGEKDRLLQWAVDQAVNAIESETELWVEWYGLRHTNLLTEARKAHLKSLNEAGSHGTDMHALVEAYIDSQIDHTVVYTMVHNPQLETFTHWGNQVKFLASEMPLRSEKLWVAGTTDFICEIDGKRYIGDLKTSNYVSFKNFMQCGAYALMYEEMGHGKIDGIIIAHMPRGGGFKVHVDMEVDKYKELFKSLVMLCKADKDKSYQLYN